MAGDPVTIAIAFAAASTAVSGVSLIGQREASKNQYMVDSANIELQKEQAKLQAAEAAQQHASGFRKALASQVALASMRGGSGSVLRQFGSESFSNFLQDQEAIKRGVRLADIAALNRQAEASGLRAASELNAWTRFGASTIDAWNINAITGGGGKAPTTQNAKAQR